MPALRRLVIAAGICLAVQAAARAQSILAVAGGGSLDGQLIKDIPVNGPRGIAFDHAGNIYIALRYTGQVLKVDANTGLVTTYAGNGASGYGGDGGLAVNATLKQPRSIVFDAADNLYIADTENDRVRRVDAKTRIITTYAGGGKLPEGQIGDVGQATAAILGLPWGLAISRGSLYITEQSYNSNRVRRVDMASGIITTFAGPAEPTLGGFGGDNGPAKDAKFSTPSGIVADAAGNLFIADADNHRVRRIDTNGMITTYAGGGAEGNLGEGGPATAAYLSYPAVLAFDPAGNLLIGTTPGLRRVDRATGIITTVVDGLGILYGMAVDARGTIYVSDDGYGLVFKIPSDFHGEFDFRAYAFAGLGKFVGDGRLATAGILHDPQGVALDASGNLYIADRNGNVIRRVSAADKTITTVAGTVGGYYSDNQDGTDALKASIGFPNDVAIDPSGALYISDLLNDRVRRVDAAGKITNYAGGGSPQDGVGDGGAATAALFYPFGISFDRVGNLYIADANAYASVPHHRIRKVDAVTKIISTVAGGEKSGFAGDDGPATQALLFNPVHAVVDNDGNLYIADAGNGAVRKVDHATNKISTIAGAPDRNEGTPLGDGGPASASRIGPLHMAFNRTTGDLYIADSSSHRIRKINSAGIVSTVAGSTQYYYEGGAGGDNGPATEAKLNLYYGDSSGIAIDPAGSVYFSDSTNNRVRAVFACVSVPASQLLGPADGTANTSTAPALSWGSVAGAFTYDVLLDTANPPVKVVAADVSKTSFTPANLQGGLKYFWRIVAKGDPFCPTQSKTNSAVASFTTGTACGAGAFDIIAPAEGATNFEGLPLRLSWQASAGANSYDLYLGRTNPPPLFASGIQQTTYSTPVGDRNLFWFVVAHAGCDVTQTASTPIHSFATNVTRACGTTPNVGLTSPSPGSTGVGTTADLTWSVTGDDPDSFDLYFGTTSTPPLLRADLTGNTRTVTVPSLSAATTYYWRLVVKSICFPSGQSSTAVASFTTRVECAAPGGTSIVFAPPSVSAGATYAIVWSPAPGLDADGGYLVERSTSPSFATEETQVTSTTAASFVATSTGTYYHRAQAIPACDPTKGGPLSGVSSVSVVNGPPNVIFTVQPLAIVTALGQKLEDQRGSFTIENIGPNALQVIVGQAGSPPFFSITEETLLITLEPRKPRTFTINYSGPPNDRPGSYQGIIFVAATGQGLGATPYAFVNLKVGGGAAAVPQFVVDGTPSDYAAFPGFSGDDSNRSPRQISIRNPGSTPMELGAEIGPEVWVVPESGWNTSALPANSSRAFNLFTQRSHAPNGSPLPRYTYLTVRTKDGTTARLLVQDSDQVAVATGRATVLDVSARSYVVPEVVSTTSPRGNRLVTRMRLTNLGSDAVQAELIFTPSGRDGFDAAAVKRAVVVVPPNDVVVITDPIVQLFGLTSPSSGQIEARIPRERLGLITVRSSIIVLGASGGGFDTPVVTRGEGARVGAPHVIYLLPGSTAAVALAETSGSDGATVRLALFDVNGTASGTTAQQLARYGMTRIENVSASRIEINVDSGGGSVVGTATIANSTGEAGATVVSRSERAPAAGASLARAFWKTAPHDVTTSVTTVVPVIAPPSSAGAAPAYKTSLGLVAPPSAAANFTATFREAAGSTAVVRTVSVPTGGARVYPDVLAELFGVAPSTQGSVFVQSPPGSKVYAVLQSSPSSGGTAAPAGFLPLPTTVSEAITSAASAAQRLLYLDGLEQSVDGTRGSRWQLVLNEIGGGGGIVNVRLYEAANRTRPIAENDFTITPYQQMRLDTIFSALGLDAVARRKDRTNVQVAVTATAGNARVAATAVSIDNQTGDTKVFPLTPTVGSGTPNISFVTPVVNQPPTAPPRRRGVRH